MLARPLWRCRICRTNVVRLCNRRLQSASRLERQNRFTNRTHVVDAHNLYALHRQAQRGTDCRACAVRFLVTDQLRQKTLARMAHQEWTAKRVKLAAMRHKRNVVFVRLAKTDARIKANS